MAETLEERRARHRRNAHERYWKNPELYRSISRAQNLLRTPQQRRNYKGLPQPTRQVTDACECCGKPPTGKKGIHLDHDHTTGLFRGWICHRCNVGIAMLGDNLAGVENARNYLRRDHGHIIESEPRSE